VLSSWAAGSLAGEPGRTYLVADGPQATADALLGLLGDPARRDALGRAGRSWVVEHHDWDALLRELQRLAREVAVRDLVVFGLFVAILPMCFFRPWVGLLTFTWLAYNRTQDLTWGFTRSLPLSQIVAMAMIAGWLTWEFRPLVRRDARLWAMILLLLIIAVSIAANTLRWDYQGSRFQDVIKIVFVALLTSALCVDRTRLKQAMFVIALALGFYGVKNACWFMLGQGTETGPGGMLKDNNDFALAMVMNLPLLWYLGEDLGEASGGGWAARPCASPSS
jgi:hypothetical protein